MSVENDVRLIGYALSVPCAHIALATRLVARWPNDLARAHEFLVLANAGLECQRAALLAVLMRVPDGAPGKELELLHADLDRLILHVANATVEAARMRDGLAPLAAPGAQIPKQRFALALESISRFAGATRDRAEHYVFGGHAALPVAQGNPT